MNQPHKHAALIHAWADGAKIQVRCDDTGEWADEICPVFIDVFQYREKPKEKVKVWDWFVVSRSSPFIHSKLSEPQVKSLYPRAEILQRIDGTEREVEL
jgi:hypothetical protein